MLNSNGFDLWANEYDKSVNLSEEANTYPFAGYKEVLNTIYNQIKAGKGKKVLDIGLGTGILSKKLYEEGVAIVGIDFSKEMIKLAKEKMPDATLVQYDFSKGLPNELKEEKFDFIISTYAIHHLSDEQKVSFIKELKKNLLPGGEILLGDVAFETEQEKVQCQKESGDSWDDDEIYLVMETLMKEIPDVEFTKIGYCAGVCKIK